MLEKSLDEYRAAMAEEPVEKAPEPEDDDDTEEEDEDGIDEIEEISKYNHDHGPDGRFTFSGRGVTGGGGSGVSGGRLVLSPGTKVTGGSGGAGVSGGGKKPKKKEPEGKITWTGKPENRDFHSGDWEAMHWQGDPKQP